jgi:hypothetical protein
LLLLFFPLFSFLLLLFFFLQSPLAHISNKHSTLSTHIL